MKQLKNLLPVMLLALLFCGCEKEEGIPEKAAKEQEFTIEEINFGQISDKALVSEVFQKVKNPTKGSFADKAGLYNFAIDSSRIKKLERNGRTTYIFLVKRDSLDLERFENLVVFKDSTNTTKAFLLEYLTDHAELEEAHGSFSYEGDPRITPLLDTEGLDMAAKQLQVCYSVTVTLCSWGGTHIAGAACLAANDGRTYTTTQTNCVWFDDGGDGGGGPGGGGGGGGGGGVDPGDGFDDSPLGDDLTLKLKNFVKLSLSLTERSWFYAASDTFREQMATFLDAHNFSDQAKTLADEMVALNHRLNYFMGHLELSYLIENPYWAEEINDFLDEDNSQSAIGFATEAIKALARDGEVDFVDGIIVNITDECQKEAIIEGMDNCSALSALVLGVFGGNYDIDYVVEKANLGPNTTASTSNVVQYNSITKKCFVKTTMDSNYLNTATDLSIARTTAHESFHASLTFMVMEGMFVHNGSPDSNFGNLMNGFVDYLETNNNDQYEGAQHEILLELVGEIASSLQNFGLQNGYNLSNSYYKDLAWGGLTHIKDNNGNISVNPLFTAAVPNINDRTRIINTIASEVTNTNQGNVNPKGTPCE